MRNPYHFVLKTTAGEIVEQDRPNWYVEEFLADQMLHFGRNAEEFVEVYYENKLKGTKSAVYSIHSDNWEELLKKLLDEFEGRIMEMRAAYADAFLAFENVRTK